MRDTHGTQAGMGQKNRDQGSVVNVDGGQGSGRSGSEREAAQLNSRAACCVQTD